MDYGDADRNVDHHHGSCLSGNERLDGYGGRGTLPEYSAELKREDSWYVYVAAINSVHDIEDDIDDPDKLKEHLERMVSLNMYMSSCRLIFEPDFYPKKGHRFEIYAWRHPNTGVIMSR